jgi:D-glycero-D-manno-heptose 1,7-bisphosphate phosphatase
VSAAPRATYRHLILDRDGVLNEEAGAGTYVRTPGEFRWLPGSLTALALLHRAGIRLSVVTNQAGIGRGLMRLEDLAGVHGRMQAEAAAAGAPLDCVLFCPHAPGEGCACRKPAPGLLLEAIERSGIDVRHTLAVGDDARDLEAARRARVAAALVRTGKGRRTEAQIAAGPPAAYDDLLQLARALVAEP